MNSTPTPLNEFVATRGLEKTDRLRSVIGGT